MIKIINIIGFSICILLWTIVAIYESYKIKQKRNKPISYSITIKYSFGQTKLVLNESQYEQFKAWLNQSEGIFQIGDDNNQVTINRIYVAAVEVKKI